MDGAAVCFSRFQGPLAGESERDKYKMNFLLRSFNIFVFCSCESNE
jgi:hypothetical protein